MKKIVLITGSYPTKKALLTQIKNFFLDRVEINGYSLDELEKAKIDGDLIVFSSKDIFKQVKKRNLNISFENIIICKRTINYNNISILFNILDKESVLLVNDSKISAEETIFSLKKIGIDHINFIPYYPKKIGIIEKRKIAVTVGELDKVPPFVEKVYDIGSRIIDVETLVLISNRLNLFSSDIDKISNDFLKKIVNIKKDKYKVLEIEKRKQENLYNLINSLEKNYIILNKDQVEDISLDSEISKGLKLSINNKKITNYLENHEILKFLEEKNASSKIIYLEKNNFLFQKNYFGEFTFIKILKMDQSSNSNFEARYFQDNIIGKSDKILNLKNKIEKLAKSNMTILLEGETGTGKELFASAIHNSSHRKNNPFIPINFSSLNETIIESELFGYEKGAFTGASSKGKKGFFELAQGGTIFLDEIGDISSKIQARLLRVLEEKEIVRLGGERIIPIDVRIIAATNKDIYKMCGENKFRKDLYYRLRGGYLKIPALRDRKEDIMVIVNSFFKGIGKDEYVLNEEVINFFENYIWEGNVRELINTLSYLIVISDSNIITMENLMENDFLKEKIKTSKIKTSKINNNYDKIEIKKIILEIISEARLNNFSIGRNKIYIKLSENFDISEYKVRKYLDELKKEKKIIQGKKSQGIFII